MNVNLSLPPLRRSLPLVTNFDHALRFCSISMASYSWSTSIAYFCRVVSTEVVGWSIGLTTASTVGMAAHVDESQQIVRAQNVGDLDQLIIVVVPVEERVLPEDLIAPSPILRSAPTQSSGVHRPRPRLRALTISPNVAPTDHMSSE